MPLPFPAMDFTAFDILTAAQMDQMVANDQALASGTGLNTGVVTNDKLSISAIKLGYSQITSDFSVSSASFVDVTGLSVTITVPSGGRSLQIDMRALAISNTTSGVGVSASIFEGATEISGFILSSYSSGGYLPCSLQAVITPTAGSHTYKIRIKSDTGTAIIRAASTSPAFILAKLI